MDFNTKNTKGEIIYRRDTEFTEKRDLTTKLVLSPSASLRINSCEGTFITEKSPSMSQKSSEPFVSFVPSW